MAEYGVSEGIGKPVLDGIQHAFQSGVEFAGKAFGGLLAVIGGAIPVIGGALSEAGIIGARGKNDMDESHQTTITRSVSIQSQMSNMMELATSIHPSVRAQAAATDKGGLISSMQEASYNPIGGYKPIDGLPNHIAPSRSTGVAFR